MASIVEIRRGALMDTGACLTVYFTESFVKLAVSAGSGEEGKCDHFFFLRRLAERRVLNAFATVNGGGRY